MSEKIEIGEYVRTDEGDIVKVANLYQKGQIFSIQDKYGVLYGNPNKVAVKHSFNIIDLIEEGDYVNGRFVEFVHDEYNYIEVDSSDDDVIYEKDIKTIVTKEQFKSVEYGLEE